MDELLSFVARHGVAIVFAIVFLDQLGLPIPTVPILLALGALAGAGTIDPLTSLVVGVIACLCADFIWFQLGRWKGTRILGWLCRVSLEPDTCVSETRDMFARHGVKSLLVAKFIPGFDTVAPPLAGAGGVRTSTFLLWSCGGALLWLGVFGGLGFLFSDSLEALAAVADQTAGAIAVLFTVLTVLYVGRKYLRRQRVLREIRMERINPDELYELIRSGKRPAIVDARSQAEIDSMPLVIEGALHVTLETAENWRSEIPPDGEVVVYCS